jgi:hypothetical protein
VRQRWIKIDDMTDAQAGNLLRLSADLVRRYENEIFQMLPTLRDAIDDGLDRGNLERLRRILFYIVERTDKAHKRVWTCLYCLKRLGIANIHISDELRARAAERSKRNRESRERYRNRSKKAPQDS